jgi:hypothetical protein
MITKYTGGFTNNDCQKIDFTTKKSLMTGN